MAKLIKQTVFVSELTPEMIEQGWERAPLEESASIPSDSKTVALSFVKWYITEGWQPYVYSPEQFINVEQGNKVVSIDKLFELYEAKHI